MRLLLLFASLLGLAVGESTVENYLRARARNPRIDNEAIPYILAEDQPGLRCDFQGCPDEAPRVYFFTSHRNRAAAYNRWLRSLVADLKTKSRLPPHFSPRCVCAAVADYTDNQWGPTAEAALEDWPWSKAIVNLKGAFSRTGGFQALFDHTLVSDPANSMFFLIDADLIAFPGFTRQLVNKTRLGKKAFAPVVWSQGETSKHHPKKSGEPTDGVWRMHGTGMIAFYFSDFYDVVGSRFPMVGREQYGSEDAALEAVVSRNTTSPFRIWRRCSPQLWHLFHSKRSWGWSHDGMSREKHWGPNPWRANQTAPWKLPVPPKNYAEALIQQGQLARSACVDARDGHIY